MDSKIYSWMEQYTGALRDTFGSRLWFVGLQGSYARGEATAQSDIDAVVILDRVSPEDLATYSAMLDRLPSRDKVCGFISGKDELFSWEPSDLFQFLYDTTPVLGSLEPLRERVSREDIRRAVWTGLCNVYHLCAHNMVHEKDSDILQGLYKSATFTLQAICYLQTGVYEKTREKLAARLQPDDRKILEWGHESRERPLSPEKFQFLSGNLLVWASERFRCLSKDIDC